MTAHHCACTTDTAAPAPQSHDGAGSPRLRAGRVPHPLDPLTPEEIELARSVLFADQVATERTRFAYLGLEEPAKQEVLAADGGGATPPRQARALLLHREPESPAGTSEDVVVCLTTRRVVTRAPIDPLHQGHVPLLAEEHTLVRELLRTDPAWLAALEHRGITDPDSAHAAALSAGHFELPGEHGRRMARVLAHLQPAPHNLPWAHPIDGLVAYIDLIAQTVVDVVDTGAQPIPRESGDYHDPEHTPAPRTTLRPIEITQPEGPSFSIDGPNVTWENWSLRIGFDMREGLILHQIGFADGGRLRPIIYRASVAEMLVPYGDPSPVRFWQNYFDTGEYQFGKLANSLELGCDCLGEITYFDVTVADGDGRPATLRNAICMHEEDFGVLWKHTDTANDSRETRRQRRLVISFFTTIGNYDYGFYWYLYLDGTIELEAKATGIVFTGVYDERARPYASEVAPGLAAPYHQHLFNARLDMMVDGAANAVDEVDVSPYPVSADNPHGNAFGRSVTRLRTESEGQRDAAPALGRTWHIVNPGVTNRLGRAVGYALHAEGLPTLLADAESSIRARAEFATRHLWVTRYHPDERYPAGDLVNQNPGGDGLPRYTRADRDIDDQDLVLWHTFGLTHFPRPEDWPVMPVDTCGFTLKPVGFFDRNPTLDVPPSHTSHTSHCS